MSVEQTHRLIGFSVNARIICSSDIMYLIQLHYLYALVFFYFIKPWFKPCFKKPFAKLKTFLVFSPTKTYVFLYNPFDGGTVLGTLKIYYFYLSSLITLFLYVYKICIRFKVNIRQAYINGQLTCQFTFIILKYCEYTYTNRPKNIKLNLSFSLLGMWDNIVRRLGRYTCASKKNSALT